MKNNFKKIFALVLVTLSLSACSQDKESADKIDNKVEVKINKDSKKEDDNTKPKDLENKDGESSDTQEDPDVSNNPIKENPEGEIKNVESLENAESDNEDSSYLDKDGKYLTSIIASQNGDFNDLGYGSCYEFYVDSETNTLIVKGSLNYNEDIDDHDFLESSTQMDNSTYTFKLDENSILRSTGGINEPHPYTIEEFNNIANDVKDSGLGLIIIVENGVVKSASIAS